MKKIFLVVLVSALVGACATPQSRKEFVTAVRGGAGLSSFEELVVNQPLGTVLKRFDQPLKTCLNVRVQTQSTMSGGRTGRTTDVATVTYRTRLEPKGSGRAALTMQATYEPSMGSSPPPGGFYELAVDFQAIGRNRTKAAIYVGRTGFTDLVHTMKSWMKGRPGACPLTKGARLKST